MRYVQIVGISVLVITLGGAGLLKLFQPDLFLEQFAGFGLPVWFIYFTGMVEVTGAGFLASFDATRRRYGSALLCATMASAAILHVIHDPIVMAIPALVLMVVAGWVVLVPLRSKANNEISHA